MEIKNFDGEIFESLIDGGKFEIIDPGPLHAPVSEFKISRDDMHRLTLVSRSAAASPKDSARYPEPVSGTVCKNEAEVTFGSQLAKKVVVAKAVQSHQIRIHQNYQTGEEWKEEFSSVGSVELMPEEADVAHLVEVVENVPDQYLWPHIFREETSGQSTKIFLGQTEPLIKSSSSYLRSGRCLRMEIDGSELYLLPSLADKDRTGKRRGLIVYKSFKNDDMRKKVRECLSFAMGAPLIYFGYTLFGKDYAPIGFKAVTPYTADGALYKVSELPPAPMHSRSLNVVDEQVFLKIVMALYTNYERLNFLHVGWLYWHAACGPLNIKAVQLGAAIESIQSTYLELQKQSLSRRIAESKIAKELRANISDLINALPIPKEEKVLLLNNANNINQCSQKVWNERFFAHLGLDMGTKEISAWQRRNDAAHGNRIDPSDTISLIKDVRLLENIFHRILLRITDASDEYIDRFSARIPIRRINECVDAKIRRAYE